MSCDIGQVPPGTRRRIISFKAPSTLTTPFFVHVSASFDEGKNSGLVDTVTGDDPFPFSIGSGTDTKGQCTAAAPGSTLMAGDTVQQTALTYQPLPPTLLPCTPVSAGVDAVKKPIGVAHPYGEISFVDFLDGAGLATVNVNFLSPPKGVTKKNLAVYDLKQKCASVRAVNIPPDVEALFTGKEEEMFAKLTEEGRKAIEEDGADVILLGSTTMHQAGDYMAAHLPAPVINPGPVAIKLTETFLQLGLTHSKVAFPSPSSIIDDRLFSLASAGAAV